MDNDSLWSLHKDSSIHNKIAFVVTVALIDGVVVLGTAAHVIFLRPHADIFWGGEERKRIIFLPGCRSREDLSSCRLSSRWTSPWLAGIVALHAVSLGGICYTARFVIIRAGRVCRVAGRVTLQGKVPGTSPAKGVDEC